MSLSSLDHHVSNPNTSVAGFLGPFFSADWFIAEQIPLTPLEVVSPGAKYAAISFFRLRSDTIKIA